MGISNGACPAISPADGSHASTQATQWLSFVPVGGELSENKAGATLREQLYSQKQVEREQATFLKNSLEGTKHCLPLVPVFVTSAMFHSSCILGIVYSEYIALLPNTLNLIPPGQCP
jgi:hypothetical protein